MIAVAFPTIMSGLVVRWYVSEADYEAGIEAASASRERVIQYRDDADLATLAQDVHLRIARDGHDADLSDVLTHSTGGLFSARGLTPLPPAVPADGAGETRAGR